MRYFSMFSGIGGFEYGIQNAYRSKVRGEQEDSERDEGSGLLSKEGEDLGAKDGWSGQCFADESDEGPLCVGYSEIDKYATKVYERHYNHKNYGDATTIDPNQLPDFDLLVGGFPCQAFSVAGRRLGFDDTRGTLFFHIARILENKRPRHLVLENVKGLLSHDSGKTFQTILGVLSDLGYFVEWQVLNSKSFGVPQNRERIYIIGHLRDGCGGKVLPITDHSGESLKELTQGVDEASRVYHTDGLSRTIKFGGGMGAKTGLYAVDLTRREEENHRVRKDNRVGTLDANYYKGLANQERPGVKEGVRVRRLTPIECERLQGFPDNWTKYGLSADRSESHCESCQCKVDEAISDTQRYKMCGNAVTTNVVTAIFSSGDCLWKK